MHQWYCSTQEVCVAAHNIANVKKHRVMIGIDAHIIYVFQPRGTSDSTCIGEDHESHHWYCSAQEGCGTAHNITNVRKQLLVMRNLMHMYVFQPRSTRDSTSTSRMYPCSVVRLADSLNKLCLALTTPPPPVTDIQGCD